MRSTAIGLILCVLTTTALGQQYQTPSDNELRSAYCIPVLNGYIGLIRQGLTGSDAYLKAKPKESVTEQDVHANSLLREELAVVQSALDRLKAYLVPKLTTLDSGAIALAMARGKADFQASTAMAPQCSANGCPDNDLLSRVRACRNPNWLPF